ncbi:MAG: SBBP repeat-containing protein, partial [Aureispira sp.]|nr:SBBP repeat-containing protein [Aureispira sp.]
MKRSNNTSPTTNHLPSIQYQRLYKKLLTKIGIVILLLLIGNITYGQVKFEWAKNIGSTMIVEGNAITVDASGNIYTAGGFKETANFNPGTGISNLTAIGDFDIFIQKLDAQGNLLWIKSIGGANEDQANSIVVDNSGNLYITGTFQGTVDFDPNAGIFNLTASGNSIFVLKLDLLGNLVWAKNMGDIGTSEGTSIQVDGLGNVYTTGYFYGTVDFDPNAGIFNLTVVGGNNDIFVQKLDAGGNLVWAKSMGGISEDKGTSIALDSLGNVYTTGYFAGTVDFDPNVGVFILNPTGGGYYTFI